MNDGNTDELPIWAKLYLYPMPVWLLVELVWAGGPDYEFKDYLFATAFWPLRATLAFFYLNS